MSEERTTADDDGATLAAEYVLGVLSAQDRRDFEHRLAHEPALASEVQFWEQRLGALVSEVRSVAPPLHLWSRIEASLPATSRRSGPGGLWQNLIFWRWAALGSATLAAVCLAALVYVERAPVPGEPLIATLDVSGGQAAFVAAVNPARTGLIIVPASVTNADQRVLELWLIAPGDHPRSLGLIDPARAIHIDLPTNLIHRIGADATLAISLEPPGGSPTGLPTGPVIANGKLTYL